MKLSIMPSTLAQLVNAAAKATPKRLTLPILGALKLDADDENGLTVSGTDLRTWITVMGDAEVQKPGVVCLPAAELVALARALPDEPLKIDAKSINRIEITAGRFKARMSGLDPEEFPTRRTDNTELGIEISAGLIKRVADLVAWCTCDEDTHQGNPILQGVLWDGDGSFYGFDRVICVRYASGVLPVAKGKPVDVRCVLPPDFFNYAAELFDGEVAVLFSESDVSVESGTVTLAMQTFAGSYPQIRNAWPAQFTGTITIDRVHLVNVLTRLDVLAPDKVSRVDFTVDLASDMELTVQNPERGEAAEVLGASYSGEPTSFALDIRKLLKALRPFQKLETEQLRIRQALGNINAPVLIDAADEAARNLSVVIAPLYTNKEAERPAEREKAGV